MNKINSMREDDFYQQFRRWDMNLLIAFDALMAEGGNVTQAARRLYIGQSAMSHALARLRELFQDELFVRTGMRMVPTARALELEPAIANWVDTARSLLAGPEPFNLRDIQTKVRLALPEQLERVVMPPLLAHLFEVAPGIEIYSQSYPVDKTLNALDRGDADLALVVGDIQVSEWHRAERIGETSFVQVFNPQLITKRRPLSLAELGKLPHLAASYALNRVSQIDKYFEAHGLTRHIVAACDGMAAIPDIIAARPIVALIPAIIAHGLRESRELAVEPFAGSDLKISVGLVWHRRLDNSNTHRYIRDWLRGALLSTKTIRP